MPTPPLPPRRPSQRLRDAFANPFTRTIILWVFLIVAFLVLWQFFRERPRITSPAAEEAAAGPSEMWRSVLIQYVPLFALAGIFGLFYWRFRSFAAANKRAVDLMASGDSAAAADAFRRLARAPLAPVGVARLNLGLALLRLGDLRGALEALAAAERSRLKALRPMVAALIALCDALAGELDVAERWIAEARRRAASPASTTRVHLAAEAIVRLRRGDALGAARLFDETWGELERCTAADLVRAFRVVRAFAAVSAGGAAVAQAADLLAGARPFRAGEYAWIGVAWPEMARYLAANGFSAAA
jgi:tetratricopeptide (TPR) repeat protein